MKSHKLPFENRWSDDNQAWRWHKELERIGENTVRAMFAEHETYHSDERFLVSDVPVGFVRDWLAFHDSRAAHQQMYWRLAVIALTSIAALAAVVGAFRK